VAKRAAPWGMGNGGYVRQPAGDRGGASHPPPSRQRAGDAATTPVARVKLCGFCESDKLRCAVTVARNHRPIYPRRLARGGYGVDAAERKRACGGGFARIGVPRSVKVTQKPRFSRPLPSKSHHPTRRYVP